MAASASSALRFHMVALGLVILAASSEQFYANRYGKRQEFASPQGQQVGFQSGSRYGRTDPDASPLGPDDRLQRRFYANGRYGKRASSGLDFQSLDEGMIPVVVDEDSQVFCRYTGVANLYRCLRRKDGEDISSIVQDTASGSAGGSVTGNPLN